MPIIQIPLELKANYLRDPENFRDFSDEQMYILENTVLPAVATLLEQQTSEVPAGHA